jgi:hypothetical protein
MRNVVLGAVIGVLAAAGPIAVTPAAKADIPLECHPGCWGAIAASLSTGQEVIRYDYPTQGRKTMPSCGATLTARRTTAG